MALALTDKGELLADPEVELIGIPEVNADKQSMHEIAYDAVDRDLRVAAEARAGAIPQAVEESVKRGVRAAIAAQLAEEADMPRAGAGRYKLCCAGARRHQ